MASQTEELELLFDHWHTATRRAAELQLLLARTENEPALRAELQEDLDRMECEAREAVATADALRLRIEAIDPTVGGASFVGRDP